MKEREREKMINLSCCIFSIDNLEYLMVYLDVILLKLYD